MNPIDIEIPGPLKFENLGGINVVIGKNGCGKSSLLKRLDGALSKNSGGGFTKYITPERGGVLKQDPNVEHNISNNERWMPDTRRTNQFTQFRQQTMVQYRRLELLVLREIDANRQSPEKFTDTVAQINGLLDNISVQQHGGDFQITAKVGGGRIEAEAISSGESELISLAIECLTFARECKTKDIGWLLLDEPDVHLHPDLQARLAKLLIELVRAGKMRILLATYSTAMLSAFSQSVETHLYFMRSPIPKVAALRFRSASEALRRIVPVFGAHPLSNIFNERKLLIVEGEDDVRIWQRAVRSSSGRIAIFPVEAGSIDDLNAYEKEAAEILAAVYDDARAYSLRDRDTDPASDLEPIGAVQRFRLWCRAAENLLLSDDVLALLGVSWAELQQRVDRWIAINGAHPHHQHMVDFKNSGFARKTADLKEIRNDLLGLVATTKGWEDAVGIGIARMKRCDQPDTDSLQAYLGQGVCSHLLI